MAKRILVPLASKDRLAQFIPFIEQLGQPGMKVVLLMRYAPNTENQERPVAPFDPNAFESSELRGSSVRSSAVCSAKLTAADRWDERRLSAEREVFLAGERLQKQGIEIVAHVYAGSLRAALKSHLRTGNVHLIMRRARWYRPVATQIGRVFAQLGIFRDLTASRVMLLRANAAVS